MLYSESLLQLCLPVYQFDLQLSFVSYSDYFSLLEVLFGSSPPSHLLGNSYSGMLATNIFRLSFIFLNIVNIVIS